jgi:hypothetical protein
MSPGLPAIWHACPDPNIQVPTAIGKLLGEGHRLARSRPGLRPPPARSVCCTTPEARPRARDVPFRAAVPSCANRQHGCLTGSQPTAGKPRKRRLSQQSLRRIGRPGNDKYLSVATTTSRIFYTRSSRSARYQCRPRLTTCFDDLAAALRAWAKARPGLTTGHCGGATQAMRAVRPALPRGERGGLDSHRIPLVMSTASAGLRRAVGCGRGAAPVDGGHREPCVASRRGQAAVMWWISSVMAAWLRSGVLPGVRR